MQLSIIEYLDETRGAPYLLPKGNPVKRQQVLIHKSYNYHARPLLLYALAVGMQMQVRAVADCIASGIQPIQVE